MKRRGSLRTAAFAAVLIMMISGIFGSSFVSSAFVEEGDSYDFDGKVGKTLKHEISKRIFEDDFNGISIDFSDLNIPDSDRNRKAIETLLKCGFPYHGSKSIEYKVCGWTYIFSAAETSCIIESQQRADELLSGIAGNDGYTEAQKAYLIHERLRSACEYYQSDELSDPNLYSYNSHDIFGALVEGRAVCDGYARSYMYLCRRAGLECYYEDGLYTEDEGTAHAWNVIYLDGDDGTRRPYYVDATWADYEDDTERFFLKGYYSFMDTHWCFDVKNYLSSYRDMEYEEYAAEMPLSSPPVAALSYSGLNVLLAVSSAGSDIMVYYGASEEPADEDFVRLDSIYPDRYGYVFRAECPGTYFAAAKDEFGTSNVAKIVITEEYYTDDETNTLHITTVDRDAHSHPWNAASYYNYVVFEDGLEEVPQNALCNHSTIWKLTLPDSVESIGAYAFSYCGFSPKLVLPDSIKSIGEYAFKDCSFGDGGIFSVPDGVDRISRGTFYGCSGLHGLTLPKDLKVVEKDAFFGCKYLYSVVFRSIPVSVHSSAFDGCESLENVCLVTDTGFTLCIPVK